MKESIIEIWKQVRGDRPLILLSLLIVLLTLVYVVYVGFSLSPSELQLATRYTAFGETQYYRDKWYYLLTFIGFAIMLAVVHMGLIVKLRTREMRPIALALAWFSIILLFILFLVTQHVLGVAYLS